MSTRKTEKRTLTKDERILCIALVRGYERRKKAYEQARCSLLYDSGGWFQFADRGNWPGDPTAKKGEALARLEALPETRRMRVVEKALEAIEPALRRAMLNNVADRIAYEYLNVPCCRDTFFARKKDFLRAVAEGLDIGS